MSCKTILVYLITSIVFMGCNNSSTEHNDEKVEVTNGEDLTFDHGGVQRSYKLYKPKNLPENAPLLVALHGMNQHNTWTYSLGFNELADSMGFMVAYPQSTIKTIIADTSKSSDKGKTVTPCEEGKKMTKAEINYTCTGGKWIVDGKQGEKISADSSVEKKETTSGVILWNDANEDSLFGGVDDVSFLSELAKYLQETHKLNPKKIYVTGFSNGGYMSYTLLCQAGNVFKAGAPVAALMNKSVFENCNPKEQKPVLHIHGTKDALVPIGGVREKGTKTINTPSAFEIVEFWAKSNGYATIDTVKVNEATTAYFYKTSGKEGEVHFYKITDHNHIWPGKGTEKKGYEDNSGIVAVDIIWKFFSEN